MPDSQTVLPRNSTNPSAPDRAVATSTHSGTGEAAIWRRLEERMELVIGVIENRAQLLLDRSLTPDECAEAQSAASRLANRCGRLELPAAAHLARAIESSLASTALSAQEAVEITERCEDIRVLLAVAISQQRGRASTRGNISLVGAASTTTDRIAWVLATRGYGIRHDPFYPVLGGGDVLGIVAVFPDKLDDASRTVLNLLAGISDTPTIAVSAVTDPAVLRDLAASCSTILPAEVAADTISTELARLHAVAQSKPFAYVIGDVASDDLESLRVEGFTIAHVAADTVSRRLMSTHACAVFGSDVASEDVIATASVVRAIPATRRTLMLWTTDLSGVELDASDALGLLIAPRITRGAAARASAVVRREVRVEIGVLDSPVMPPWLTARVLTDRALVAAYRSMDTLAVAVMELSPTLEALRLAEIHEELSKEFRRGDIVGLKDTHSVVICLRSVTPAVAKHRMEGLLDRLAIDDQTAGVGIAMFPSNGGSADELVTAAEEATRRSQDEDGPKVVHVSWQQDGVDVTDVLLVESDPLLGQMLSALLTRDGLSVETLADGASAISRLTDPGQTPPRLLVVDLDTAGLDGLVVIRRLRQRGALASSDVLLMTSRYSETDLRSALELGVADILRKPFSRTLASHRIKRILSSQ